jgi:hypothetical protein
MIGRQDQHRIEVIDRRPGDIVGHIEHRAHGEVGLVGAQHGEAVLAGDVG